MPKKPKINITSIVLTYNEERNIRKCLDSISGWCDVIIVDSFSTDNTLAIAREYDVRIYEHVYENHVAQWDWALANTEIKTDWIFTLDADFTVTEDLKQKIELFLSTDESQYNGFYAIHQYVFWNAYIRFGGIKKYWLMGLRKGHGKGDESDMVDFRFNVEGKVKKIRGKIISENENDNDVSLWMQKQDKYSMRMAVEEELRRRNLLGWEGRKSLMGNTDQRFKVFRDKWRGLPLFIRPIFYFIYRYFIALGFLDGLGGFLYHFQQGLWFRMVVDMKIYRIRKYKFTDAQLLEFAKKMLDTKSGSFKEILEIKTRMD